MGCPKRLHKPVDNNDTRHFKLKGEHIHTGDSRKIGKKKVMTKLKNLAKNTKGPIRQVISESILHTTKATRAKLPSEKVMARMVSNYRRTPGAPKNPSDLTELILKEEYRETVAKKPFLVYDSFDSLEEELSGEYVKDRMLIFTTRENLKFLSLCDEYFMDGTFSVTPPLFKQLYSIHGKLYFNRQKFNVFSYKL